MNAMAISNENVTIRSIKRARLYKAPVSSGVEILPEDIASVLYTECSYFTLSCSFSVSARLAIVRKVGSDETIEYLNSGGNLPVNALSLFTFPVDSSERINIRFYGSGSCLSLILTEHGGIY